MEQPRYHLTPLRDHERNADNQESNYSPLTPSVAELLAEKYKHIHPHKEHHQEKKEEPVAKVHPTVEHTTPVAHTHHVAPVHHTKKKGIQINRTFLSITAIVVGVGGIGFGVFSYFQMNKLQTQYELKQIELKKAQSDNVQYTQQLISSKQKAATTSASIDAKSITQVPKGFIPKQTTCFTMYIPRDHTAGDDASCELVYDATIGTDTNLGASVQTIYQKFGSLKEMVEKEKETIQNSYSSEGTVLVGDTPGEQINEILPNGDQLIHVYVYHPDSYSVGGVLASGFEITKTLQGDNLNKQLEVFYTLLGTWKWK